MYVKVRVVAGAKKERVEKKSDDHYIITVKEKAERNLANNRIRVILSEIFGISASSVRIISGHQSPSKILSVEI